MSLDKKKLKSMAHDALSHPLDPIRGMAFQSTVRPHVMLALLEEIESDAMHMRAFGEVIRSQGEQIDQLKAENEALRKQVVDLSPFKNASPQDYRASNKCLACGEYHHGLGNLPCPRCTPVAQSAMAKEASNG